MLSEYRSELPRNLHHDPPPGFPSSAGPAEGSQVVPAYPEADTAAVHHNPYPHLHPDLDIAGHREAVARMELAGVGIAGIAARRLGRSSLLRLRGFGLAWRRREDRMVVAGGDLDLDSLVVKGIGCIDLEGGRRIGFGVGIGCIGRRRSRLDLGNRTWRKLVVSEQCGWQ